MRYAIVGRRPGEVYHIPGAGRVATDPTDGGARLTDAQKTYFELLGWKLKPLGPTSEQATAATKQPDPPAPHVAEAERASRTVPGANAVVNAGRKGGK